jgi:hypothetical protein
MFDDQVQREAVGKFEGGEFVAQRVTRGAVQAQGGRHIRHRQPGRGGLSGLREELAARCGDETQRAFGTDEQLLQVIARVVLAQAAQAVEHPAIRQHHFKPEHQLARGAKTQHRGTTRIGREVAAQLATALRRQAQRKQPAGIGSCRLQGRQHAAGFGRDAVVGGIEVADPVQATRGQQDFTALWRRMRNGAADQAGVPALRHHRDAMFMAVVQDG